MQEEVTQKTMALAITTSRMTASVLAKAMRKFLEAQKNKSHQLPKGKQTLKELMKHNTGVSNLVHWKRNPTTCRLCLGGTFLSVKRLNYRQR